jgi:hypothetical protein
MRFIAASRYVGGIAVFCAVHSPTALSAQLGIGTWVRQSGTSARSPALTLTVEACCNGGRRLIYRITGGGASPLMTVDSPFDGSEVPAMVGGKPSGETMAIKRVDDHHTEAVLKMNGKLFATSKATLSADGRTLTVVNDVTFAAASQTVGKQTEVWVRQ